MRYFWPLAAGVVALAIVGIVLGLVLTRGTPGLALKTAISWNDLPGLQTKKPPWPDNTATVPARLGSIGVEALPTEGVVSHIHQHLDLFVGGKKVTVPRFIGIYSDQSSPTGVQLAELHTHVSNGVVHVESGHDVRFKLGQFFGVWGVRLTAKCLGSFKGSCDNLQWWLGGKKQTGNPAALILKSHQEIAISVGPAPKSIPSSYKFAPGE